MVNNVISIILIESNQIKGNYYYFKIFFYNRNDLIIIEKHYIHILLEIVRDEKEIKLYKKNINKI